MGGQAMKRPPLIGNDFHAIKRALDDELLTPIEALHRWTTCALKHTALEIKPWFEYVRETLPIVTWHQPGEELLVHGYLPVTWTCPTDFYEWADDFMGLIISMGAHLRGYVAEEDPDNAATLLNSIAEQVERARRQVDPASQDYVKPEGGAPKGNRNAAKGETTVVNHKTQSDRNRNPGTLRRIARVRPDLLARIESGELSVNAAAVEAGIRRRMAWIPCDTPDNTIRAGLKYFTLAELRDALQRVIEQGGGRP